MFVQSSPSLNGLCFPKWRGHRVSNPTCFVPVSPSISSLFPSPPFFFLSSFLLSLCFSYSKDGGVGLATESRISFSPKRFKSPSLHQLSLLSSALSAADTWHPPSSLLRTFGPPLPKMSCSPVAGKRGVVCYDRRDPSGCYHPLFQRKSWGKRCL